MTIADSTRRSGPYAGAGQTGPFVVGFKFIENSHLVVTKKNDSSLAETTLVLNVDYTVTGAGSDAGGNVTLLAALAIGFSLTITRDVPITQLTDYVEGDPFPADSHEEALDKLTMIAQQLDQSLSGALRVPETSSDLPTLPAATDRANKILAFDASGNPTVTVPVSGSATDVLTQLANSSSVAQGDAQIAVKSTATGGVARTQHQKNADLFSVKDVGATSDGSTTDTTAVTAALVAQAATGGALLVPGTTVIDYGRKVWPGAIAVNNHDYATVGSDEKVTNTTFATLASGWTLSNFTASGSPDKITHAAGTVGSASRSGLTLDPFCLYRVSLKAVTTTAGVVDVSLAGNKVYQGVYTDAGGTPIDGVWLDSAAVDVDGSGVNGVGGASGWPNQSSDTWTFLYFHRSATPASGNITLTTDVRWAGNIQQISVIKVATETQFAAQGLTQSEAAAGTYREPIGFKITNNQSDCAIYGDRRTGALIPVTPGAPPYSGALNTLFGVGCGASLINGVENVYLGSYTAQYTEGSANCFYGYSAGRFAVKAMECVGIGYKTQYVAVNTVGNTSLGTYTLNTNRTGNYATAIGELAGRLGTALDRTTVVGAFAGVSLEGTDCTLVGYRAGPWTSDIGSATSGFNYQVSIGSQCYTFGAGAIGIGYNVRIGANGAPVAQALVIGYGAIGLADNSVAVGYDAQVTAAAAASSVAIGVQSRANGSANVCIGNTAGTNVTGTDNTAVGNNAGKTGAAQTYTNCTSLGANSTPTGSNQVTLGNASVATLRCQQTTITALSDSRFKTDITDLDLPDEFIDAVRIVTYRWIEGGMPEGPQVGVIAQQLDEVQERFGLQWLGLVDKSNPDRWEATPGKLLFPLIVQSQRQSRAIADLLQRVEALERD